MNGSFMLHVYNHLFITHVVYICRMIWCSFDSNLRWTFRLKQYSQFYCQCAGKHWPWTSRSQRLYVTYWGQFDGCEVEQIVNRCMSNNDSDEALKQNYTILIGVMPWCIVCWNLELPTNNQRWQIMEVSVTLYGFFKLIYIYIFDLCSKKLNSYFSLNKFWYIWRANWSHGF
jgi:hypothetical protein